MLDAVIVMLKRTPRVVRRIDVDTLHLPRKLRLQRLQRLQRQQVVAKDQPVVEAIRLAHPRLGAITPGRVFQQDARFQAGAVVLADPGEF